MAEITPTISTDDLFSLGASFNTSRSVEREENEFSEVFAADGDYACGNEYDARTEYEQVAKYCGGGSPDIDTALGTFLTTLGAVQNSKLPTNLQVHFEAGEEAEVTVSGHQHSSNAHAAGLSTADASGIIPASSGLGVPTLITVTGDCSPVSADVTFSFNHIDKMDATGVHGFGQNTTFLCEISVQYEGLVTGHTAGSWLDVKVEKSKENQSTPTSTLTAKQYIDKA